MYVYVVLLNDNDVRYKRTLYIIVRLDDKKNRLCVDFLFHSHSMSSCGSGHQTKPLGIWVARV